MAKNKMPKHKPEFDPQPREDHDWIKPPHTEEIANVDDPFTEALLADGVAATPANEISSTTDNVETLYVVNWNKLKNSANAVPVLGQKITQPSRTIPDQAMTIAEILRRNAQGLSVHNMLKVPFYDGAHSPDDIVLPDLSKVDLADRQDVLDEYQTLLEQTIERIKRRSKPNSNPQALGKVPTAADQGSDDPSGQYPKKTNPPGDLPRPPEAPTK